MFGRTLAPLRHTELTPAATAWLRRTFDAVPTPHTHIAQVLDPTLNFRDRDLQALEVLGDRILNFLVRDRVVHDFPSISTDRLQVVTLKCVTNDRLINYAAKIGLCRAAVPCWSVRKPLADRLEMLVAALYLDGHGSRAEELFKGFIDSAYIENLLRDSRKAYPAGESLRPPPLGRAALIKEWLHDRGATGPENQLMLRQLSGLFETQRQQELLIMLGRSAVEASMGILAYREGAAHLPCHLHSLVHDRLPSGNVSLQFEKQSLSVLAPDFLLTMGFIASCRGLGLVTQLIADDPSFHRQLRTEFSIQEYRPTTQAINSCEAAFPANWS